MLSLCKDGEQNALETSRLIVKASSELARCKNDEVEAVILRTLRQLSDIQSAEQSGWFHLGDSGALTDILAPRRNPTPFSLAIKYGLDRLPWCLAQLNLRRGVVIGKLNDLPPAAKMDRELLRAAGVSSFALLPSQSDSLGRTILILLSLGLESDWSDQIIDDCTVLENLFTNAYQRKLAQNSLAQPDIQTLIQWRSANGEPPKETKSGNFASLFILSQEDERRRIARELHDDIGQKLSLASSDAALLAQQHAKTAMVSTDSLCKLRDELDTICSDIHDMSHALHSYKLEHLGLQCALRDLCRRLTKPNFTVELHLDNIEEPLSKEVSLCLYRVAQESLNNALRHAHTSIVAVTLSKLQDRFFMTIQDRGTGFDRNMCSGGLGLISMSERIKLVRGQFRLHSTVGRGTEIWVEVPDQAKPSNAELNSFRRRMTCRL